MGALSGSIAVRRYRVMDRPPRDFKEKYAQAVKVHTLIPLNPKKNPSEERAIGWCSLHDNDDLELDFEKFHLDGRILLSLRVDVIKPPTKQVKRLLKERQEEAEEERKSPLSRTALRDLKDQITQELRRSTPPKVRTVDLVWKLDEQLLYFFSHSKGSNELMQDLFTQTFGIPLDVLGPGSWAEELAEEERLQEPLAGARPTAVLLGGFPGLRPGTREVDELLRM